MSFETAMHRLGGSVITEANPMVSSSAAKEESLADMMKVMSKYANVIVLRHPNDVEARDGASYSESPVINGGFGNWEHPTQALLDLYTLWRTHDRVEGLNVCIASADLIAARTGHSMAYGLARLGANVTLACPKVNRTPEDVMSKLDQVGGNVKEVFDLSQDGFNELISEMDLVYLPGCSAPKGPESDAFKQLMDDYFVRFETLEKSFTQTGRITRVTHTLPRRASEMDPKIDTSQYQQYFEAIAYSVSIRMALVVSVLGI
jgi:aspartate carbamoyltransferase catalytic subunit